MHGHESISISTPSETAGIIYAQASTGRDPGRKRHGRDQATSGRAIGRESLSLSTCSPLPAQHRRSSSALPTVSFSEGLTSPRAVSSGHHCITAALSQRRTTLKWASSVVHTVILRYCNECFPKAVQGQHVARTCNKYPYQVCRR